MLKNYLLVSIRNLIKHRLYSLINIFSLAVGIAVYAVIFLFIQDEKSFDSFHMNGDRIYRLDEVQSFPGTNTQKVALSMPGMGPNMSADFKEIDVFTRYWGRGKRRYQYENLTIIIDQSAQVDSTFLDIFDFELIAGDRETALDKPNSVVLTKETASKIFTDWNNSLNQQVRIGDDLYVITGILENVPENSHLQFDALISMSTTTSQNSEFDTQFGSNFLVTYFVVNDNADLADMESRYPAWLSKYMPNDGGGPDVNDFYRLFLQPLPEVHLASMDIEHDYHNHRKFNGQYLDAFVMVGLFIMLIAAVNFMNLALSRANYRWKEVGIRKSIGAMRSQLFQQFVVETMLLSLGAFLLALMISLLFVPILSQAIDRPLSIVYFLQKPGILLLALSLTLFIGFLAGLYPAVHMSSYNAIKALKIKSLKAGNSFFQKSLVVLQFGLAIAMIVSTLVVIQQLLFIQNQDVGFNKDEIILVDMNGTANDKFEVLKGELLKSSHVLGVTASGQRLGNNFHQWGFKVKSDTAVFNVTPSNVNVDYDYLDVYGIKLKQGRGFSKDITSDNGYSFIINESFAREIDLDPVLGATAGHGWYPDDSLGYIIGITEDFNFNSLHYKVNTLAMAVHPNWGYDEMSVKVNTANLTSAIQDVGETWNSIVPDWPSPTPF